jgi:hypothetical protein
VSDLFTPVLQFVGFSLGPLLESFMVRLANLGLALHSVTPFDADGGVIAAYQHREVKSD